MKKDKCIINAIFNRMTVIGIPFCIKTISPKGKTVSKWKCLCRCECGIEKEVNCTSLVDETTKSCGCLNLENVKQTSRSLKYSNRELIKHPLYSCFKSMKNTCRKDKTVTICDEWVNDFETFYNWAIDKWSDGMKLSRVDKMGQFNETNCYFRLASDIGNENLEKSRERIRETHKRKYNGWYTKTDRFKADCRDTCMSRYGYNSCTQVPEFKAKGIITNLSKYGTEYANQNQQTKDKIRQTCQIRYGVDSPTQNKAIRQKQINTCLSRYGVPFYNKSNLKEQNSVRDWLLSQGFEFNSDYSVLEGKEIDLYNDDLKIGIEYCGLRWHSESRARDGKVRHYAKYKKCNEKGVRLITVFADEWLKRNSQVKSFILSALNKNVIKYHGRKCVVQTITNDIANPFLDKYHIQGKGKLHKLCIGIYHEDELLGVMTFNIHHRNNKDFILDRLAFKSGVKINGGVSKMISVAKEYCKINGIKNIVTWSDNRWSNGQVYEACGFKFDEELPVDYSYIKISNPRARLSKQSCTKKNIKCPEGKTEYEYMLELGFDRIWDCGKKRFILTIV